MRLRPPSAGRCGTAGWHLGARPRVRGAPRRHDGHLIERVADEFAHRCRSLRPRWIPSAENQLAGIPALIGPIRQHQFGIVTAAQHCVALTDSARRCPLHLPRDR